MDSKDFPMPAGAPGEGMEATRKEGLPASKWMKGNAESTPTELRATEHTQGALGLGSRADAQISPVHGIWARAETGMGLQKIGGRGHREASPGRGGGGPAFLGVSQS